MTASTLITYTTAAARANDRCLSPGGSSAG